MRLQPAYETTLCHGDHAVTLRASLRAAVTLSNHPEGFAGLIDQITRQSLTAIRAAILAAATDRREAQAYLRHTATLPLSSFLPDAQAAAMATIAALLTTGDDAQTDAPSRGGNRKEPARPSSWRDYYADLFKFGTGWLGWPPSEVWNASPAEIKVAFLAHIDRLVKTTPGATQDDGSHAPDMTEEQRQENVAAGLDPEFNRAALHALKARHGG